MKIYKDLQQKYGNEKQRLTKRYNRISLLRLLVFILIPIAIYYYLTTRETLYLLLLFSAAVAFLALIRLHQQLAYRLQIISALLGINSDEIDFLELRKIPFEDGGEFIDPHHPYAYDLDIFGPRSLFQHLNRTGTSMGKTRLKEMLWTTRAEEEIVKNQQAVEELTAEFNWRQKLLALAKVNRDSREVYEQLLAWSKEKVHKIGKALLVLAYAFPVLLGIFMVTWMVSGNDWYFDLGKYFFVINLLLTGSQMKRIKAELQESDDIEKSILQYSRMLEHIEQKTFEAEKLKGLQVALREEQRMASTHIKRLSRLFNALNSAGNLAGALIFNGICCYHLHVLKSLQDWKEQHAGKIGKWLDVIGEFEFLGSLANFRYNNPAFAFPAINANREIVFSDLGHPLIASGARVCNDVQFQSYQFIVLTGSNMSGKSTFLRSLGVNMVLTGMGAPVCASAAAVHPMQVLVSMRLSDSLSDHESYFYAEVKRLKEIMDHVEKEDAFVLLDEILRGTNSDDKRSGTMNVIRKMVEMKAVGAIATHDLEVCKVTAEFPDHLVNKCFEVEIVNDDLHFDYQLRDGICRNRNATFLMKKMKVI